MHPLELEERRTYVDPADAGHWVSVYDELIRICRDCVGDREPPESGKCLILRISFPVAASRKERNLPSVTAKVLPSGDRPTASVYDSRSGGME